MDFEVYKKTFLIRTVEKKLDELFKKGLVHGTAHFCIGQEFIPVIISQYLTDEDAVTSTHRGHGHALAKGLDVRLFLAELLGKKIGYNRGKGGSQHVSSKDHNFFANGITGGMMPVANGMAFADKYKGKDSIVVAYLGDGTMNEGFALEALNMAKVLDVPVLFVCENNFYAMSTHVNRVLSATIKKRVEGFGIICETIPENNYNKLDLAAKTFISDMRKTPSPRFIEVQTYRHHGHSKNDQNLYRDKKEEQFWFGKDAVPAMENELIDSGKTTREAINAFKEECTATVNTIADEVIALPEEEESRLLENVYAP